MKKESNPPGNGFDLLDVFNEEIMFHVSIRPEDQVKVTPSEFPKYVDRMNESLGQYSIVAAGKLLDINDLYAKNNIDRVGSDTPYDILYPYFSEAPDGFGDWSKERMLDAFIDVTPAQYILPIWEYVPNAVTPDSYFNPPSPTPTPLTLDQEVLLLGIGKNSTACKIATIQVYHFDLEGKKYRCWVVSILNEEKSEKSNGYKVVDLFEVFNSQYLFSLSFPNNGRDKDGQGYSISQGCDFLSETNPALKGMKLEHAFALSEVAFYYQILEIDYNNDEFLNGFCEYLQGDFNAEKAMEDEKMRQTFLSVDEMKEHFLNSTPQEEILPFWVFTPGTQIPEELKEAYSEVDYPPAPAE